MDLASINAAITGLRAAKDTFQVMLGLKIEAATQVAVVDGMSKVVAAQETILRLQAESEQIRQDLKARDDWDARKARYSLQRTVGGAIVHASDFERHFACPACFEKREVQILQYQGPASGYADCPSCRVNYLVSVPQVIPIHVEGGPSPFP